MSCYSETYQGRNYNLQKSCCFLNSQANWRAHNSSPHKWYCHFRDWHNWYLTLLIKLKLILVNFGTLNYWYWAQFTLKLLKFDISDLQNDWHLQLLIFGIFGTKAKTKLHDLKVAVGYPNETQSFFQIRDRSVIVISKKYYPILYCSFLA